MRIKYQFNIMLALLILSTALFVMPLLANLYMLAVFNIDLIPEASDSQASAIIILFIFGVAFDIYLVRAISKY